MKSPSTKHRTNLRQVFDSRNSLGIPDLDLAMCAAIQGDEEILTYNTYRVGRTATYDKILTFFVDDFRFQSLWSYYDRTAKSLADQNFKAICEPDFSLWTDRPTTEQIYAVFQTRWLGAFFQHTGIKVIPILNWSDETSYSFAWLGIPKGAPTVALETRSCGSDHELFNQGLAAAIETVEPQSLLVYGEKNDWLEVSRPIPVYWKEPETNKRFRNLKVKNGR